MNDLFKYVAENSQGVPFFSLSVQLTMKALSKYLLKEMHQEIQNKFARCDYYFTIAMCFLV